MLKILRGCLISNFRFQISYLKFGIWNLEFEI
jgi:hypothetical protein